MSTARPSAATSAFAASTRALGIAPSASMALEAKAKAMKAAGQAVISFGVGEPDFPTPEPIKAAAQRAMEADVTHYTTVGGEPALRKAIAERTAEISGVGFTETQVIATTGAKEALYLAFQATCDAGDEVIIPAPYWVSYAEQARLAGATPVVVQTDPADWKLTPELLRQHLTPRTKLLVLCTPSNPTGIVYSDAELRALADVLQDTRVGVMVDEIYARISHVPVGRWLRAAPETEDRTIIIDGVSKAYAMTGWRLGWMVGPEAIVKAAAAVQSHLTSHPSSITQRAALYALQNDPAVEQAIEDMVRTFKQRREVIVEGLSRIDGLVCPVPDGAFYVYPDVRGLYGRALGPNGRVVASSDALAAYLLEEALVSIVPGEAFGTPGFLRLSYALALDDLREGVARIQAALRTG
ncbi:MAG: pyridoxal phosphate-dependent aminotransferase [Chloroflexi bacterium]|nr:pyridoxal phosphate-dependent aminotransferase [Chloroflexota bacterium]